MNLGSLGSLAISLQGNTAQLEADLSKSQYMVRQAMGGIDSIIGRSSLNFQKFGAQAREALNFGDVARSIAQIAIPSFSVAGIAELVKSSVEAQANLADLGTALHMSASSLAGFQYAAQVSGSSLDSVATGIQHLSRYIGDAQAGNKLYANNLKALGISATDPQQAFVQLANVVQRIHDPTQKAAVLNALLGRSYLDLVPLLNEGGAEIENLVKKGQELSGITEESAKKAKEFDDRTKDLTANLKRMGITITNDVLPSLDKMVGNINNAFSLADKSGVGFFHTLALGVNPTASTVSQLAQVNKQIADLAKQKSWYDMRGMQAAYQAQLDSLNKLKTAAEAMNKEISKPLAPKPPGGNLDPAKAGYKSALGGAGGSGGAADPAASLRKLDESLRQQVATFNEGAVAVMKYRLSVGDMAATVKAAGGSGHALAADILARTKALEDLRQKQKSDAFDAEVAANDAKTINDSIQQREQYNATIKQLADNWRNTIDPLKQYRDQLTEVQRLTGEKGGLSAAEGAKATAYIQQQMQAVTDGTKKTNDFAKQLGLSFQSAFEGAVVGGKSLRQVLQGLGQDIEQMLLRKMVTEPLANSIGGMFGGSPYGGGVGGSGLGGIVSLIATIGSSFFANGGIMTGRGPVSLRRYAGGGIATGPQLAMYGEGSSAEAYVPLPDGRSIPVTMQGGGNGGTVTVNIVEAPGRGGQMQQSQSGNNQMLTVFVEQVKGAIASDISRGRGVVPAAMQQAYGLNRAAGAH